MSPMVTRRVAPCGSPHLAQQLGTIAVSTGDAPGKAHVMSPCRAMGWIVALGAALLAVPARAASSPNPDRFFETQVRPLLAANCVSCHGEKKQKGDLRLDSLGGALKGGKDGPVLVP